MSREAWTQPLLDWYQRSAREMPWRSNPLPYHVWVSEIMLQQTQVDTVTPYFHRFIKRFPTVQSLALADLQAVLTVWEGLGYYSRARNLHRAAKQLLQDFGGEIPSHYDILQLLPGVGAYTAAAISSIAFNRPVPVVDGNVLRVFSRFWGIQTDIRQPSVRKEIFNRLGPVISQANPRDFNQAIMELGALLCKPKEPRCPECPLQTECTAFKMNLTKQIPYKSKSKPLPHYHIAVGIVWKGNRLLIAKRRENQMLGGLWEFPGGKCKPSEALESAVKREISEETDIEVVVDKLYTVVNQSYTHFKITLHAYKCFYLRGEAKPLVADDIKWVSLEEIVSYPFPKANKKVLEVIQEEALQRV